MRRLAALLAGLVLIAAVTPLPAQAASSDWAGFAEARVRLVSATAATGGEDEVLLGLQFRMDEGWKISWRSPGDAGLPPRLDWQGSRNLVAAAVSWPAPARLTVLGFETFGYRKEVVLPIRAKLAERGRAADFALALDYLACSRICVPASARLALHLPEGPAAPTEFAGLIADYAARVPGDGRAAGLSIEAVSAGGTAEQPQLVVDVRAARPLRAPDVFVEGRGDLRFGPPRVEMGADARTARLVLAASSVGGPPPRLAGERVTLTLVDGTRAAERTLDVAEAPPGAGAAAIPLVGAAPASEAAAPPLPGILLLALLGGLILNLMPCVLPVLSIKLLTVVGQGGKARAEVRQGFLAAAAGIIACFLLLAAAVAGLKATGHAVGWGIQFQHPAFLAAMGLILILFACNLWGLYEIRLPSRVSDAAARPTELRRLSGHFLTGMLATVLATPCTAPFLGTAVGFALARGPGEIFAVFAALGLGLSAPYLAVAAAPGLASRLPHPGRWMIGLKRVLAAALAGTALWLLSILAAQASVAAAAAVAGILAAVIAVLAVAARRPGIRRFAWGAVAGLAALAFLPAALLSAAKPPPGIALSSGVWRPFERAAIPQLVAEGRLVLVDITADWCLTCKVNKALVLDNGPVAEKLRRAKVVAMRADWTKPDPEVADYLASFGRYGIPFNAIYGPGAPEGIALPELLTERAVLRALDRAAGAAAGPLGAEG